MRDFTGQMPAAVPVPNVTVSTSAALPVPSDSQCDS